MNLEKLADIGWAVFVACIGICGVAMAGAFVVGAWLMVLG